MMSAGNPTIHPDKPVTWLSGLAALAGVGAMGAATCCALPVLLAGLGLGGAWLAPVAGLGQHKTVIFWMAGLLLAASWGLFIIRARHAAKCMTGDACMPGRVQRRSPVILLGVATLLMGGAVLAAHYEVALVRAVAHLAKS